MMVESIRITGTPFVAVPMSANPYFIADSVTHQIIEMMAARGNGPETGLQVVGSSSVGGLSPSDAFKIGVFSAMVAHAGAGDIYGANFVADLTADVAADVTGISAEADLNVRNVHYGDDAGAPQSPYATNLYLAAGGDKRASAALMINGMGGQLYNRGIVFWNGQIRLNTFEDHCDLPNGSVLFATGTKVCGVNFEAATFAGFAFKSPGFSVDGLGNMIVMGQPVTAGPPDSAGTGYRILKIPN